MHRLAADKRCSLERKVLPSMTQIQIDASVFTASGSALGRVSGPLEFRVVPRVGEVLSFEFSPNGLGAALSGAPSLHLKVEKVLHTPGASGMVLLMLENIFLDSAEAAKKLAEYLSAGFDLFYEPYGDDAL